MHRIAIPEDRPFNCTSVSSSALHGPRAANQNGFFLPSESISVDALIVVVTGWLAVCGQGPNVYVK